MAQIQANWNWKSGSEKVKLSPSKLIAYINNDFVDGAKGTTVVHSDRPLLDGIHYWEILFHEPPCGAWVVVGVCSENSPTYSPEVKNLLGGTDDQAWGLNYKGTLHHNKRKISCCKPFYSENTTIGVELNVYTGKLSFYKDGELLNGGYKQLWKTKKLYPAVCSTAAGTVVEVVQRSCTYGNLQDMCILVVLRNIKSSGDVDKLPLPPIIKGRLQNLF